MGFSYYEPDYYLKEMMKAIEERVKKSVDDGLIAIQKKIDEAKK